MLKRPGFISKAVKEGNFYLNTAFKERGGLGKMIAQIHGKMAASGSDDRLRTQMLSLPMDAKYQDLEPNAPY